MSERKYETFNYPHADPNGKTLLTGVRQVKNSEKFYITGFYEPPSPDQKVISFVYKGDLKGNGKWYELYYPGSPVTNLYGPNNGKKRGTVEIVGNYTIEKEGQTIPVGCLYQGKLDGSGKWTTLIPPFQSNDIYGVIAHSNMGGLVVGNYDYINDEKQGKAFLYDINKKTYYKIEKDGIVSITAYGIWYDGCDNYTICGGLKSLGNSETGYIVKWDNKRKELYDWKEYKYNNDDKSRITHFDGITTDGKCGYNLTGDWLGLSEGPQLAFFCNVNHKGTAKWSSIKYPSNYDKSVTSGNTVYKNNVIGVYTTQTGVNGYISFK